ncbi:uncharacterized protein LACBIDRAFT_328074 [Laccaria bicolor S238N-H82]|uniref:Predicted protein n=1 Tax=Laccaria bicolor (strain S238N-H82 / ATCC MYA-4686) TaxID=486041 RepID=B0DDN7_LACBS|nr:uncharacterized protein LACBIDRAFT_328074 [Laccaria bicolor S238N-H82]EDR07246.1 predicted protein [Laccaria bicolor S238N-H82]|eukprot:XP_001882177.1 predicted protein [Laccaria bicolor S238N-H82]
MHFISTTPSLHSTEYSSWGTLSSHPASPLPPSSNGHVPSSVGTTCLPSPGSVYTLISSVHPALQLGASSPHLFFDVRKDISQIRQNPNYPFTFADAAFSPPTARVSLRIQGTQVKSDFTTLNGRFITIGDILQWVYLQANSPVSKDVYNSLPRDVQSAASTNFRGRVGGNTTEFNKGLYMLDVLGPRMFFVGLCRSPDGVWDAIFSAPPTARY